MVEHLFNTIDKPVKKKKKRRSRKAIKHQQLKLLLYLNPDKTCVEDIAQYVFGTVTAKNKKAIHNRIRGLREDGWIISKAGYQLDDIQYTMLRAAYAKRGDKLTLTLLEPGIINLIASGRETGYNRTEMGPF